jgi:hypothetical protein
MIAPFPHHHLNLAMQPLLKPHPAIVAFLLTGGAFLTFLTAYLLKHPDYLLARPEMNTALFTGLAWAALGGGVVMWVAGGILFGKGCGMGPVASILFHALPLLGLVIMRIISKNRISRGVWALKYRGVADGISKRTHREMKALY